MKGAVQATKLNVKLFDQVEDEGLEAEARNPMFGVLGLFFFMVVFLGVCMSRFYDHCKPVLAPMMPSLSRRTLWFYRIR